MRIERFNIRVYGILLQEGRVLLSREWYPFYSEGMLKFPGGGMHLGEGVSQCLKREFLEEAGVELQSFTLHHVEEDVIPCLFDGGCSQVVPVYYKIEKFCGELPVGKELGIPEKHGRSVLEWHDFENFNEKDLTFEVDQKAFRKLFA